LPGAIDRPQIARRKGGNEIVFSRKSAGPGRSTTWCGGCWPMISPRASGWRVVDESAAKPPPGVTLVVEVSRFDADRSGAGHPDRPLGDARPDRRPAPAAQRIDDR
jgi:hypothetical protein